LFGEIDNGKMILNDSGIMIKTVWHEIPVYYHGFNIHEFIVMPNHIHGIIQIISNPKPVGAGHCACPITEWQPIIGPSIIGPSIIGPSIIGPSIIGPSIIGQPRGVAPTTMSLFDIVHRFKTLTTKRYTDGVKNNNWPRFNKKLWQRNYYEHIIRDEKSYAQISAYIQTNPLKWQDDNYYD
jgi:REP element-mobilizing transposase RayT